MKTNPANPANPDVSRRQFLKTTLTGTTAAIVLPNLVPSSVLGADGPNSKIQIAQIGCGRIGRDMDMPGILKHDIARIVAVCDLDSNRVALGKKFVEDYYARKKTPIEVRTFADFRELLKAPGIDAVAISTPDHWHAQPVIEAALAGKDIYVQKPLSLTLVEGRQVSNTVRAKNRVFLIGSQQRSTSQFRIACELVRNGRLGKLHTIKIGLPSDEPGGSTTEMPVPTNLNYDMWLGSTPQVFYTEDRVHPQKGFGRGGWLRCEQFGAGMITGWGAHHLDIANWGMGTEFTGPIEITGKAKFLTGGLWDVHGEYHVEAKFANGVTMIIDDKLPNGIRFEGEDGWIFVTRGNYSVTASDPVSKNRSSKALDASDPKILTSKIGPNEIHLMVSNDHHGNWLNAIKTRAETVAPVEPAHRACSACLLSWAAMKLGRKLTWDPAKEVFINDDEANALRSRPQRAPYGTNAALKKA